MSSTSAAVSISRPAAWRAVVAASIGNALEWFDLVVYGFFAVVISKLFFPSGNDSVSILLTLGTFGVSFYCGRSGPSCSARMPTGQGARPRSRCPFC